MTPLYTLRPTHTHTRFITAPPKCIPINRQRLRIVRPLKRRTEQAGSDVIVRGVVDVAEEES